jgi:C-terminal peptidase prc
VIAAIGSILLRAAAASEPTSEAAFAQAQALLADLYLDRAALVPHELVRAAAGGLVDRAPPLFVTTDGVTVALRDVRGEVVAEAGAADLSALAGALERLADGASASGLVPEGVDVRLALLDGMTRALDSHSRVLAGDAADRFDTRLKGTLVGIGVTIGNREGRLRIISVQPGGPADRSGARADDEVVRIGGVPTVNMSVRDAISRIRGDAGTPVTLVLRSEAGEREVTTVREEVLVPTVTTEALSDGVLHVRVDHFSQQTLEELTAALDAAVGLRGVVLDLRGNTGGSMKESAQVADVFVERGLLLRTAGPEGGRVKSLLERIEATDSGAEPTVPVVVAVDARTASGSEIVAGALVGLGRAVVIGAPTYGKGTVQKVYRLDAVARMKLTVAEYLLAEDLRIQGSGIVPDVVVAPVIVDERGARRAPIGGAAEVGRSTAVAALATSGDDPVLRLAQAVIAGATGGDRQAALDALAAASPAFAAAEEARITAAMAEVGVDWAVTKQRGDDGGVEVALATTPVDGGQQLDAVVRNLGRSTYSRGWLELECDGLSAWDGLGLAIGALGPRDEVHARVIVPVSAGLGPRTDAVTTSFLSDGRPPIDTGVHQVALSSSSAPHLAVAVRLDGAGGERAARVTLTADQALTGVELAFEAPGDAPVELVDQAARVATVEAGVPVELLLALRVGDAAASPLRLDLVAEADDRGELDRWSLELPLDGAEIRAEDPTLRCDAPVVARTGPLALTVDASDDAAVAWVTVHHDGEKVAYVGTDAPSTRVPVTVEIQPGANTLRVDAADGAGHRARLWVSILGVAAP